VRDWLANRIRLERRLTRIRARLRNLDLLAEFLQAVGDRADTLPALYRRQDHGILCKRVFACAPGEAPAAPSVPANVQESFPGEQHEFHVLMRLPEQGEVHDCLYGESSCEVVQLPDWLIAKWNWREKLLAQARQRLLYRIERIEKQLLQHLSEQGPVRALKDLALLRWYIDHSVTVTEDHKHCRVTGWTTFDNPTRLNQVLEKAGIDAKLLFLPTPHGKPAPVGVKKRGLLTQPFRLFVDFAGTPSGIDPTPLLAVLVPVLFGLMFPDLGHGLVIAIVGLVFWQRFPALRILVSCGLFAAVFGILFGETFGSHEPFPALLFCPYQDPVLTLLLSLLVGAVIILLGLALSGAEAYWRGELRQWLWQDAAVLALYVSVLAGVFHLPAFAGAVLALAWYLTGIVRVKADPWSAVGRLLQSAYELAVNTLSFARIGAFALAHAALTHMLLELAAAIESDGVRMLTLVLGHGVIIAIEGILVFVQTTRLVLFEFFVRFLRADGRLFRPIDSPAG
jgi:V/A-type H+-transporting ATPase subunit I